VSMQAGYVKDHGESLAWMVAMRAVVQVHVMTMTICSTCSCMRLKFAKCRLQGEWTAYMPCKYKVESQCGREPVSHSKTMHERRRSFSLAFEHLGPRSFLDIHDLPLDLFVCPERHNCLPLTTIFSLHTHPLHLLDKNLRSV